MSMDLLHCMSRQLATLGRWTVVLVSVVRGFFTASLSAHS
jgi:hypothetical protein